MIDESILIGRYKKDIRVIVYRYLHSFQFGNKDSFHDDLFSEAYIAFILACRSFGLQSYELSLQQRTLCKLRIESALRVFIWKLHHMGGYNTQKLDRSRCLTETDIAADSGINMEELAGCRDDDYSRMHVADFLATLDDISRQIILRAMQGYDYRAIGSIVGMKCQSVDKRMQKIRDHYNRYISGESAA